MLKLEENPPMLPECVGSVLDLEGPWWVAHTKPRCEKALAGDLLRSGVRYYLPMALKVKISGGRKRRLMIPLFTSYVFFCGDAEDKIEVFQTDRVVQIIPVKERESFVQELYDVERALASNGQLDIYPFAAVGKKVRVHSGPFMGIVGTIVQRDHRPLLVLQVSMLGCGAALEIEPSLLEPIE